MSVDVTITKFSKKYNIENIRHKFVKYFFEECKDKKILNEYKELEYYTDNKLINHVIFSNLKENYCEDSASLISKDELKKSINILCKIYNDLNEEKEVEEEYKEYILYNFDKNNFLLEIENLRNIMNDMNEEYFTYIYHVTY